MNIKRFLSLALALLLVLTCVPLHARAAEGIAVNETNFPDDNFRAWVLALPFSADGVLTQAELACEGYMDVSELEIQDLTGIEHFTALEWLSCDGNQLTSLDLSQNTKLRSLHCSNNQLTNLYVNRNTKLEWLKCDGNQLTDLYLGPNTKLTYLSCTDNQLPYLDVSQNTALTDLWCDGNQLTILDVSRNTALTDLVCDGNQLTDLYLGRNTALTTLSCTDNQLTSLNVRLKTSLENLYCSNNQLFSLDVSQNDDLEYLICYNNQLTSLDVSQNTKLEWLRCDGNQLTNLNVNRNTKLEVLTCRDNQLTSLDVSHNTKLRRLDCWNNQLTSLDLSRNTALNWLDCTDNQLTVELDARNRFDLSTLPGFDVTKAGDWVGGTVNGTILTADSKALIVTYTYQMGNSRIETFKLKIKKIIRESGSNRFETATKVADQMKTALGVEKFDAVILANGYNFADALAGAYLSSVKSAPILLTWNGAEKYNYLNDATIEYVKNNLNPGGTVYILGGTSAVPASIDEALSQFTIKRMNGANRFETNLMILQEAGIQDGTEILVCTATNFADSLSASAAGKPILLVFNESGKLYGDQPKFLEGLKNCTFTVIGGESAVSAKLADAVGKYGTVTRLAGKNRFETSVLVAQKYFEDPESAVLAYAWDFPDGLCGGGLAYAMGAPLILTMTKYETQAADYIQSQGISSGIVLGGEGLISAASVEKIFGN